MKHAKIGFCIIIVLCIGVFGTRSYADGMEGLQSAWQKAVAQLQYLKDAAQSNTAYFTDKTKKFLNNVQTYGLGQTLKTSVRKKINIARDNVYAYEEAVVRHGNAISQDEYNCLIKRMPKMRAALEKITGKKLFDTHIPKISLILSGGGYRAMLGAIGFLSGCEKIGILDATSYISALSGSTWAVAPWIATGMSLTDYKEYICSTITRSIYTVAPEEANYIASLLASKLIFREPITTVDIYGALIANKLLHDFGDRRQLVRLSDLKERTKTGDYPYPIFTAIDGRMAVAQNAPWFEFTPDEIGCADFALYVPTWAYGRKFNAGKSINNAPEQSLGFQLGTFGSAFGVHVEYAWSQISHKLPQSSFKSFMSNIVKANAGKRVFWSALPNYMIGIQNQEWSERKYLKLVDAGLAFNLPYPPVSGRRQERKSDILIICDMSAKGDATALKKAEEYARHFKLPFPAIDYENITEKTISLFFDPQDINVPIVIYMPRVYDKELFEEYQQNQLFSQYKTIKDFDISSCVSKGFCETTNFQYSREQSQKVIDLMEFNVVANKENILGVIRSVVHR